MDNVSGLLCYVENLDRAADFYEALGFKVEQREPNQVTVRLGEFTIDFVPQDKEEKPGFKEEAGAKPRGSGTYLYIKVDNVDEFFQKLLVKHMRPSAEPQDWPWGNREFVIRDPDGYKLVFFNKIKS